ncbi:hypothetical protein B0F90DRAFT_1701694 [Multifurca ochricompacta]|uniref:Uncharacterized protein n=1 Tax=Multifurca ochricompacta TaxID=376703 RepID=A0AAD4QQH2_9AGAM|nr:hypothetical protein B0F90DRAFT_1701694 [Multifurca ochricompacta]
MSTGQLGQGQGPSPNEPLPDSFCDVINLTIGSHLTVNPGYPTHNGQSLKSGDLPGILDSPGIAAVDDEHTQYPTFNPEKLYDPPYEAHHDAAPAPPDSSQWIPIPLRTWFWVSYVLVLVAGAIALEVALHFSHKNHGWPTKENAEKGILHYVYTLPAVGVTMILVGMWAWTDLEVKRLQPYVDLLHGGSPPQRSLLLDYTRTHNAFVWVKATSNRHYIVALASIMALVALSFQPVAAALFSVRDAYQTLPETSVNNLRAISLNQDQQIQDLTSFLGASGFASASIVYGLGDPAFIHDGYTLGAFELPLNLATNGTLKANTTAILTDPGCRDPDRPVTMNRFPDGSGWNNSATFSGCQFFWQVDKSSVHKFGAETMSNCTVFNTTDVSFAPVIFWFFTYSPTAMASVTMCVPEITLLNVEATVDLASSNLTHVRPLSNLTVGQGVSTEYAGNVTGAPLYGRAYNGLNWTNLVSDPFVNARAGAIQLQLPAAVFQHAVQSAEGLTEAFVNNTFASLSATVYTKYLSILATLLYFVSAPRPMTVTVSTFQKRLFLSDVAVHLLSIGMLVLALFGTIMHLLHRYDRRGLRLLHEPGTLASAAAFTAQTPMAELLDGRQRPEEINQALQNLRFRIDPLRMKIVTEGEPGYETAQSPTGWRKSFFGTTFRRGEPTNGDVLPGPSPPN